MEAMNCRSALALGLSAAVLPVFAGKAVAATPEYGPTDGEELFPGIRMVDLGTFDFYIPAYKSIQVVDVIFQPMVGDPGPIMDTDMLCYIYTGEFRVKKINKEFTVKQGDMYTCAKGKMDQCTNITNEIAFKRVAFLISA